MFRLVVFSVAFAVVAANPITFWRNGFTRPLATSWNAPLAAGAPSSLSAPIFHPVVAVGPVPPVGAPNYRGLLSLAFGQPANILAADSRPLNTLSVNLDRAVHNTARALEASGRRLKRSILAAPIAAANLAAVNLAASNWIAAHLDATNWARASLTTGPLGVGTLAASLNLGQTWVGPSPIAPLIAPAVASLGVALG